MKRIGLTILVIGLAISLLTGLTFFTSEKVVDIGSLEISAKKKHSIAWSPILGLVAVGLGGALCFFGRKESSVV